MRPIKFRAWDNEAQVMREFSELQSLCLDALVNSDSLDLEQYTGMKDSKGNEIFEGDILQTDEGLLFGDIVFSNGSFGCCGFNMRVVSDGIVIGNIHENPELLEDK